VDESGAEAGTARRQASSEYLKTAKVVSRPPWGLNDAATYLRDWVRKNQEGVRGVPPKLRFMMGNRRLSPAEEHQPLPEGWTEFAVGLPRAVITAEVTDRPRDKRGAAWGAGGAKPHWARACCCGDR
jgi:hypothetical protein